ncbi:glycosyltransferase family 2 protein [Spartinivicinus ruber]|uniref:glycosyltransferase family 2 protein n=1 Tax=Spartinivicinus ruber TaxID=2683272 RepID=UPI001CA44E98|nr:glycosyltransferase [Spartinivicinus ruber]
MKNKNIVVTVLPIFFIFEIPLNLLIIFGAITWFRQKKSLIITNFSPRVSVIITCYSEGRDIEKTLISLCEQVYSAEIEIIAVIDGASSNKLTWLAASEFREKIKNYPFRKLILIPKWQRGGRVSTLNAGLSAATGDIIINVDGDTSFDNDMVYRITQHFSDPNVPAVGGGLKVRNYQTSIITKMQAIEYMLSIQLGKTGLAQWNLINNISGAFGAFRRSFIQKIGGWDTHTAEDLDLTVRIKQYMSRWPQLRIPFEPLAVGHTDVPHNLKTLLSQRLRWDGDLMFLYLRKHKHAFSPSLLGWKTYLYTVIYGVMQNVMMPLIIVGYTLYISFHYSSIIVASIFINIYLLYLLITVILYVFYLILISDAQKKDVKLAIFLIIFPLYSLLMRFWTAFSIINELFRRSHEESGMAPWWVLKRGNRF